MRGMTEKESIERAIETLKEEISGLNCDNPFYQDVSLAINALKFKLAHTHTDKHCRDCKWLCGDKSSVGIRCLSPKRKKLNRKGGANNYKQPCCIACKTGFEPK